MTRPVVTILAIATAAALAGCSSDGGGSAPGPVGGVESDDLAPYETVRGSLYVEAQCGDLPKQSQATEIEITDVNGLTLGLGKMEKSGAPEEFDGTVYCVFDYTVEDVPTTEEFYGVKSTDVRNVVRFSREDLFSGAADLVREAQ